MAILGESFKEYVRKQINVRQDKLSLRDKDNDILRYITSKTSFLRLSSGVNISQTVAQNLGVIGLENNLLAKKYVLFSSRFNNELTSNIGYSSEAFNTSYGFNSDTNYGLVPPPGLITATINTLNRGTIREATINLVCHNLYQFKIINALFLKLKYSLLLEWGHTLYFNNGTDTNPNSSIVGNAEIPDLSKEFLDGNGLSSNDILKEIEIKRKKSCGNYDAFFGVVKNFNWDLQENGSYNITINAISQGDVIDSLKINTNLAPEVVTNTTIGVATENIYKKSTLHYILGWIIQKLKDSGTLNGFKETEVSNALNTETLAFITGLTPGYKKPDDTGKVGGVSSSLTYKEGISVLFNELGTTTDGQGNKIVTSQYYIKLGTLLRIIEAFLLYYDTDKKNNGSSPPIFNIDYSFDDEVNECITSPRHISSDPLTCLIPLDFNNIDTTNTTSVTSFYNSTIKTYSIGIDGSGTITSETSNIASTESNLVGNPNLAIAEDTEVVIGTADGNGVPLLLVINLKDTYADAYVKIQNNLLSLTGQTVTITVQKITRTTKATITNAGQAGLLSNLDDSFRNQNNPYIANTMHIYVNINKIIEVLDNNIDSDGNVTIYNFLTQILGEISRAMCSINKFDIDYDESTNHFSIIDTAVFPQKYQNLAKEKTAKFNINLLKTSNNEGGSFITNFGLKSDVFGQISNAIAIGSQASGNNMGSNSTSISNFNVGLTDRIITKKKNENNIIPPSGNWVDNNPETFKKYEQFKIQIVEGSIKTYDIDLYRSSLVDLINFDLGYYTENDVIPGTGFIPLNLQLTMDGLSGIRQYQTFDIDETLLPNEYTNRLKFITTTIAHKIDTKGWETTISSLGVPKTNKDPKPVDQNIPKTEVKIEAKKQTVDVTEESPPSGGELRASDLKEGDVIGTDSGPTSFDRGRKYGIDHILIVIKNPSTNLLEIWECAGPSVSKYNNKKTNSFGSVKRTSLDEKIKKLNKAQHMYVSSYSDKSSVLYNNATQYANYKYELGSNGNAVTITRDGSYKGQTFKTLDCSAFVSRVLGISRNTSEPLVVKGSNFKQIK